MYLLLTTLAAQALATPPATDPTSSGWADLVYPASGEQVPTDGIFVVSQYDLDVDPVLYDAAGNVVPATVHAADGVRGRWKIVVPDAPLAPGDYDLFLGDGQDDVVVYDGLADEVAPPVPVVRQLESPPEPALYYRLCGDAAAYVVAVGESEPSAPTVDALGDAWLAGEDLDLAGVVDLSVGWTGSVWFGSFDTAGRFSGWTGPDAVEIPDEGCAIRERMAGAEGGLTTTPTSFTSCPDFGAWNVEDELTCGGDAGTDTGAADTGAADEGGGCSTTGGPGPGVGLLLALGAVLGRRRSGPARG